MTATKNLTGMNRTAFLEAVRTSGLIPPVQFDRTVKWLSDDAVSGAGVARDLVAAGVLTEFQCVRLLAGKTDGFVVGQYQIQDQIGKSSVGRIYRARHRTMNRLVAIKVLAAEHTQDTARRAAFQAEARAAARLAHPNVVTVLDVNQMGDRLYLVLEYVDGVGLDRLVREHGPLPASRACDFVRQALLGLAHAHEKGMIHGAITPANLLVGRPGGQGRTDRPAVKVANFGLGRVVEPTALGADDCDPFDYRAPELLVPKALLTPSADLYAIGCTLYFLLTGRAPFAGGSSEEKARRHLSASPPDVEQFRPDVPAAVAGLVRSLLAKDPRNRPSDAAQVAAALEPFCEVDDPARIDFRVPAASAGPASINNACLSGLHSAPPTERIPPVERDVADTSPWSEIDSPTLDDESGMTPLSTKTKRRRPERTGLLTFGYAIAIVAILLVTGVGAGYAIGALGHGKVTIKKYTPRG